MPLLSVENLSKSFDGLHAVSDLNLNVPRGMITGLIGPNGAGKTTVVNLITGLLAATSGKIVYDGADVTRLTAYELARRGIARTFQNIRLLNEATVLDNIVAGFHRNETTSFIDNLLGLPSTGREREALRQQAFDLLKRFNIAAYAKYPAGALAYGHQRRVEMARALSLKPDLLLLDEPVAGMNDSEANELGDIFLSLAQDGMAVLLIEHNMRFVTKYCSQLFVLNTGMLIASGTPDQVINDPTVIAAYLGDEDA